MSPPQAVIVGAGLMDFSCGLRSELVFRVNNSLAINLAGMQHCHNTSSYPILQVGS